MRVDRIITALALTAIAGVAALHDPVPEVRSLRMTADAGGALTLTGSAGNRAILGAGALAPGGFVRGELALTNGDAPSLLSLEQSLPVVRAGRAGASGASLADRLQLVIDEIDASGGAPVFAGPLAAFAAADLGAMAGGEQRRFRFRVTLPDGGLPSGPDAGDNLLQGASASVDYRWVAAPAAEAVVAADASVAGVGPAPAAARVVAPAASANRRPAIRVVGRRKVRLLRFIARNGVKVRARCSTRCTVSAYLVVRGRHAGVRCLRRRVVLRTGRPARPVCVLGVTTVRTRRAGAVRVTVRPTPRLRRALSRRREALRLQTVGVLAQPGVRLASNRRFAGRRQLGGR